MNHSSLESVLSRDRLIMGRYRPVNILGRGGMGLALRAEDTFLQGADVVLKFLYPHLFHDDTALDAFRSEVLIARRLIHPNIVRTHSFASDRDFGSHIVMEFISGATLRQRIESSASQGLPFDFVLLHFLRLLTGLRHAHHLGVVHLDIKPENIFLSGENESKLGDFGLAQSVRNLKDQTGRMVGTPLYMAPEQFRGELLGKFTDIYALGIVLYEMLAGRPPFQATTLYSLAEEHRTAPFPSVVDSRPDVPDWFQSLILRCVEKAPEKRFTDCREILNFLESQGVEESNAGEDFPQGVAPLVFKKKGYSRAWRVVRNKRFLGTLLLVAFLIFVHFGRKISWLHSSLLFLTLHAEKQTGIELTPIHALFNLRTKVSDSLFVGLNESGGVPALLSLGASPDQYEEASGRSFLVLLVESNPNPEPIANHLSAGANPNHRNMHGETALHVVRGVNAAEIAHLLIAHGANVNLQDRLGETPLLSAVRAREYQLAQVLLASGADPNIADKFGVTPAQAVRTSNDPRLLAMFSNSPR